MVLMAIGSGYQLNTPAGLAYLRARRDGCPAGINSATRSYQQQLDWYLHQGQKGYPETADNPNRSKHVWRPNDPADKGGRALDLPSGGAQEWMRKNGHKYGWMKDRVSGEKWHFEYEEWNDPSRSEKDEEDVTLTPAQQETIDECRRMLGVLLTWQKPQGPEVAALAALRATGPSAAEIAEAVKAVLPGGSASVDAAVVEDAVRRVLDSLHVRLEW